MARQRGRLSGLVGRRRSWGAAGDDDIQAFSLPSTAQIPRSSFGPGFEFVSAIGFQVTEPTIYFEGYWWWVCPSAQSTAPQKFCLWQDTGDLDQKSDYGQLVERPRGRVRHADTWAMEFGALPAPIALSRDVSYRAATASPRYAPTTNGQLGSGGAYASGITNGPLFAFADSSSGNSADVDFYQPSNCT